ncbi:MAG: tRNA (adenosine(37)-N6)-threonylcarbamoyltransferase complex dimerization subunit type 1 TsaB [Bacteroidales bacterium]|nr:tRNA (adenosine(37)-N6)-threonylcarbamoyltransferase complex dimerization subunit type 1 TsaB [Lentimicrobiaceae bacterium]MDD5693805.1 tRNA (adenosine(37)-N6)-threonylcarbamoyltransferase complex dimerization subunit type 1 TsaB [Bacteroidales bacterium]
MATLLCLDTATAVCSVALGRDGELWKLKESHIPNAHSSLIISLIEEVMTAAGLSLPELDAIAVSQGPGSYTGLRIGVSTVKGLCFALGKPMIAVDTLQSHANAMAVAYRQKSKSSSNILFCPMIDARRMEVYAAIYDLNNAMKREIRAEVITEDSFGEYLADHPIVFFGDGAAKCQPLLQNHLNAIFDTSFLSSASHLVPLAEQNFRENSFVDVAYFEPFYLKEFIPGKPRVKGLR